MKKIGKTNDITCLQSEKTESISSFVVEVVQARLTPENMIKAMLEEDKNWRAIETVIGNIDCGRRRLKRPNMNKITSFLVM